MTISMTPRHDYREGGKFAKRPVGEARRRYANDAAYLDDDDHLRFPEPPQPWGEPPERDSWIDWRAVGLVLFVIAVLSAAAWSAWA